MDVPSVLTRLLTVLEAAVAAAVVALEVATDAEEVVVTAAVAVSLQTTQTIKNYSWLTRC